MVSAIGKNRLRKKYSSDFSYYFNNPELSDIIIQVTENGYTDQYIKPIQLINCSNPPTRDEITTTINNSNNDGNHKVDFFYAHKFVLSARSPVFSKMLSCQMMESHCNILTSHFPKNIFYSILKFMYSGNIEMEPTEILDVLASADYYQLDDLKEFCGWYSLKVSILGESDLDICRVLCAAEQYGLDKIKSLCLDYISQHSMDILLSSPNWHLLSEENLISILDQDNLRVPEVEIFDSLVRWADKQYTVLKDLSPVGFEIEKQDYIKKKLEIPLNYIRFASMFPHQLSTHIEKYDIVGNDILFEAYRYCAAGTPTKRANSSELRQGVRDFDHDFDGDTNGVLYYLGSSDDTQDYESPVTRKIVKVTSSTMSIGYPHPFAGRTPTNMYTDKEEGSYFCIDLGPKHVLCPTYYTMRYGGDSQGSIYAAPKNWQLLGSLDGEDWTILKEHVDDVSLKDGYSMAGWEIKSIHSYRYLKVLQTGPNQRDGNELCVCCFEAYGRLVHLEDDDDDSTFGSEISSNNNNSNSNNDSSNTNDDVIQD
ncbi:hypothetical protein CYY_007020 [Polysphondylium violaceum]|uniref:BTB domain-containing protein n=1 Tax=Polysphondylium violaceum TaxID=133409 RepID=A0A8J4PYE1_9MYCE|nr:hypothetical protein CYY_007020 [Polysphondylium violaceum]